MKSQKSCGTLCNWSYKVGCEMPDAGGCWELSLGLCGSSTGSELLNLEVLIFILIAVCRLLSLEERGREVVINNLL